MKCLTEKQLIKQWAKQANRFFYLTEGVSTWGTIIKGIKEHFDKGVADNQYIYFIALDRDDGYGDSVEDYAVFLTSANVNELINSINSKKFDKYAIAYINSYITHEKDLCDNFNITQHDDSSYDRDEIQEKAEELYDEAFYELNDDLEDELKRIANDPPKIYRSGRKKDRNDRNGIKGNEFATVLGSGDTVYTPYKVVFGITNYKKHIGKLMSDGKLV